VHDPVLKGSNAFPRGGVHGNPAGWIHPIGPCCGSAPSHGTADWAVKGLENDVAPAMTNDATGIVPL
jgi:hypothetical protein